MGTKFNENEKRFNNVMIQITVKSWNLNPIKKKQRKENEKYQPAMVTTWVRCNLITCLRKWNQICCFHNRTIFSFTSSEKYFLKGEITKLVILYHITTTSMMKFFQYFKKYSQIVWQHSFVIMNASIYFS